MGGGVAPFSKITRTKIPPPLLPRALEFRHLNFARLHFHAPESLPPLVQATRPPPVNYDGSLKVPLRPLNLW